MFFYYIAIYFLAASIVVFASPISYDPNGLIETGVTKQSSVEGIPDIVAFNPDLKAQSLDDDSTFSRTVSADTSTIPDLDTENNTMTVSDRGCITNDHTDDATQKRNILRRLNPQTACPTTGLIPTTNPTRVKTPTSPSILRGFKTQTQKKTTTPDRNPCVGYSRLAGVPQTIHVSCGGPVVGDFPSDPDIVFDCMPGSVDPIPSRSVFQTVKEGPPEYCCHKFVNEMLFFEAYFCSEIKEGTYQPLHWTHEESDEAIKQLEEKIENRNPGFFPDK